MHKRFFHEGVFEETKFKKNMPSHKLLNWKVGKCRSNFIPLIIYLCITCLFTAWKGVFVLHTVKRGEIRISVCLSDQHEPCEAYSNSKTVMVRGRSTGVELSHNTKLPQVVLTLGGVVFVVVFLFGLVLPVGNLAAHCLAWCYCFVLGMFKLFQIIPPYNSKAALGISGQGSS